MSKIRIIGCLVWFCLAAPNLYADSRYALVIGNNRGDVTEDTLRFAEKDARRVRDVLGQLGNFDDENVVTMLGKRSDEVRRAFGRLEKRIGQEAENNPMLVVYYSGHADSTSLHLDGTRLEFSELRSMIEQSPAAFKVLVIDACKSGEFTRVKGAEPAEAFDIEAAKWQAGHGMAIITSSAAGEDAQESDRLEAGFFTHYLIAGLRGAADASGDKEVTLSEVYEYVYKETLRATSLARFIQHPTYAFDIRGRRDVTLTRLLDSRSETGYLRVTDPGRYLLFDSSAKGELVAEIQVEQKVELALEEGDYFVRRRVDSKVYEASLEVDRGALTVLFGSGMDEVPLGEVARKGIGERTLQWAIVAGAGAARHPIKEIGASPFLALGLHLDTRFLSTELRFRAGYESTQSETLTSDHVLFGGDLTTMYLWDFRPMSFGVGLRGQASLLRQSFESRQDEPSRNAFVGGAGPVVGANVQLWSRFVFGAKFGTDALVVPRDESDDPSVVISPYGEFNVAAYF